MSRLMPVPEHTLTLPIAALAAPPARLSPVLRDCLSGAQEGYLAAADYLTRAASSKMRPEYAECESKAKDYLADAWQEALGDALYRSCVRVQRLQFTGPAAAPPLAAPFGETR